MATSQDDPPTVTLTLRRDSPSPELRPTRALGAPGGGAELSRCLSTASSASHGSATTDNSHPRESLGSDTTASSYGALSRHSSASFRSSFSSSARPSDVGLLGSCMRSSSSSRYSTMSMDRQPSGSGGGANKRRGYMRPHGTDFAASARQRESVLSLGSIAHLQYYFARTGLLDGKGAQLARKRALKAQTLDFSQLDTSSFLSPAKGGGGGGGGSSSDVDSSYASMGSSPEVGIAVGGGGGGFVESPIQEDYDADQDYYLDEYDEPDPGMLPPTASTYVHREKPVPKPPSMEELRADLNSALDAAAKALEEVRSKGDVTHQQPRDDVVTSDGDRADAEKKEENNNDNNTTNSSSTPGWYEVQGVHILDVMTLAIRAAKVYYTSHDHPDRLDSIKPEKAVRAELLAVMDGLKRMATRNFAGGVRPEELALMDGWVAALGDMLRREDEIVARERSERAGWSWLRDEEWVAAAAPQGAGAGGGGGGGGGGAGSSAQPSVDREYAFLQSLLASMGASTPGGTTPLATTPTTTTSFFPAAAATAAAPPPPRSSPPPMATTTTDDQQSQQQTPPSLPPWTPIPRGPAAASSAAGPPDLPTPFLRALQSGLLLVRLHNAAVRKSQRRFGAIASYHTDTAKPYRCADNLRYWIKAAELRWEVRLSPLVPDPLAVVYGNGGPEVWVAFEDAVLAWCRKVRGEIAGEFAAAGLV